MKARRFDLNMVPVSVCTDSYKQTHAEMYPEARAMSAYIEARTPFEKGDDDRVVCYGARYFAERWLMQQWTEADIQAAEDFYSTFNAGNTPHPFPRDLFTKFVSENQGYFPVEVKALRDGTVCHVRTPQMTFTARGEYARLVTWLETVGLQTIWYMSTVATLSRLVVDDIRKAFDASVDEDAMWKLRSRLHDFAFRGCTSTEQAIMGGAAHLLNSDGTDTSAAAWYVQYWCNDGKPVGSSIPATEHSCMTSHEREIDGVRFIVRKFAHGVFATVADSYDYTRFLNVILPQIADEVKAAGGFHVVRPDSGDPVACVLEGLRALEKAYGFKINRKGFKVILGGGIIQGDGINRHNVWEILKAVMEAGYSAENVAFGMGAGLLQKVNRDTLGYAMKLSYVEDLTGTHRDIMKLPKTDLGKASMPGLLAVKEVDGVARVFPEDCVSASEDLLETIWDCGPVGYEFEDFDSVRVRADRWQEVPIKRDNISDELRLKISAVSDRIRRGTLMETLMSMPGVKGTGVGIGGVIEVYGSSTPELLDLQASGAIRLVNIGPIVAF